MKITNKKYEKNFIVKKEHIAKYVGSGDLEVLSTPMLVAYMEESCNIFLNNYLEENYGSVGSNININHLSPSKINSKIKIVIEITDIKKEKFVYFDCQAFEILENNEYKKIGSATHTRVIINNKKFLEKL